jgi:hypothetical protein
MLRVLTMVQSLARCPVAVATWHPFGPSPTFVAALDTSSRRFDIVRAPTKFQQVARSSLSSAHE